MFWNKKEEKGSLPDLPPLKTPLKPAFDIPKPGLPQNEHLEHEEGDDGDTGKHGLPSFPDSPIQKGFSQTAIKDAISQEPSPEEEHEISHSSIKTMELESETEKQQMFTLDEPPERPYIQPRRPLQKSQEILVKIDKFNNAYRTITSISKKVEEIDTALRKIREVKLREEQELAAWEKELASLKSRLQEINDNLFE